MTCIIKNKKFNAFNCEQREKVVESKTPGCYHYRREKEEEEEVSVKQSHNAPDITSCLRLLPREREKRERRKERESSPRESTETKMMRQQFPRDASMGRTSSLLLSFLIFNDEESIFVQYVLAKETSEPGVSSADNAARKAGEIGTTEVGAPPVVATILKDATPRRNQTNKRKRNTPSDGRRCTRA